MNRTVSFQQKKVSGAETFAQRKQVCDKNDKMNKSFGICHINKNMILQGSAKFYVKCGVVHNVLSL